MQARDIMTTGVINVQEKTTLKQAVETMLEKRISGLPVTDEKGRVVGMITEGDLLRRGELATEPRHNSWVKVFFASGRLADEYVHAYGRLVSEIMSVDVVTATPETSVEDIVTLMMEHKIKRIPIVQDGQLIGVVSRADVLRALAARLSTTGQLAQLSDDDILRRIWAEFDRVVSIPAALIHVKVQNGDVTLTGSLTDERQRAATRVAVENVLGVRAIHDHLVWVEPASGFVLMSPEDEKAQRQAQTGDA